MTATREKYRVTMRNTTTTVCEDGSTMTVGHEAVDYVPTDVLHAYVTDAATRWQTVQVSDGPDAGPGGEDGPTAVPEHLRARTVHAPEMKEN